MNKRFVAGFVLFALLVVLALPGFIERVSVETKNAGVCLSLDYLSLAEDFADEEIPGVLFYAKERGIDTVSLNMSAMQSETVFSNIEGFDIALFIDEYIEDFPYAILVQVLYEKYSLRHLSVLADNFQNTDEYTELMDYISDKNINLVFTENKSQSANEGGFARFPYTKRAAYMRCYNTVNSANDKIDTERRFHQMLNSLKDRNTHFINIVPFEDKSETSYDNFRTAISAAELFIEEMNNMGYPTESFDIDYSGYKSNTAFNMSLAAVVSVFLCYGVFVLLMRRCDRFTDALFIALAALCIIFAYLCTSLVQLVYPLLLTISLSAFIITALLVFAKRFKDCDFGKYIGLILALFAACVLFAGYFLSSVLSGAEYYMYFYTFRGVKLALLFPVVYAMGAYIFIFDIEISEIKFDKRSVTAIAIFAFAAVSAVFIYLMRSGNSAISGIEVSVRDAIDTFMGIRPRTKEFLIGYPAFLLALWYFKYTDKSIFLIAFVIGIGILVGSVINSFCHVFTPCIGIYHRTLNGILLGIPFAAIALGMNILLYKFLKRN